DALQNARYELALWDQRYADELLSAKEYDKAFAVASDAIDLLTKLHQGDSYYASSLEEPLAILKAKIELRSGKKEEGVETLKHYAVFGRVSIQPGETENSSVNETYYRKSYDVLVAEKFQAEAEALLSEMYEKLLSSGRTEKANYIGLAEIKLDQKKPDE